MIKSSKSLDGSIFIYRCIKVVLYTTYRVLFRFRSFGTEKVPSGADGRGLILAPNHASYLDPPILGISIPRRVTYLAKDYLFRHWLVGWVLRSVGAFPIKTKSDDFRSVRDLIRILRSGHCLVVFPEGTRSENGQIKSPESGVGFLALKSHCPVVPVYIEGSYEAFPKGAKKIRYRPVRAYFGEPFVPAEDPSLTQAPDPYVAVSQKIMEKIENLKSAVSRQGS